MMNQEKATSFAPSLVIYLIDLLSFINIVEGGRRLARAKELVARE